VSSRCRFWGDAVLADAAREQTLGPSTPVGLEIPAIGVRVDVVPIGSRPERALDVPVSFADAPVSGVAMAVPIPGADMAVAGVDTAVAGVDTAVAGVDTAVAGVDTAVAGVDTAVAGADTAVAWDRWSAAPGELGSSVMVGRVDAAFAGLRLLRPGDEILVRRADGVLVRFVVTGVGIYPQKAFPNQRVYGSRDHPELTLVTRGGTVDRNRRSYGSNLVVYARSVPD
jgi:hypothetical protein